MQNFLYMHSKTSTRLCLFFLIGFLNDCDAHVVKINNENFDVDVDEEMLECGVTARVSPVAVSSVGQLYDAAVDLGKVNNPVCHTNDVVNQYSAILDLDLDIAKQRKQKMLDLYGLPPKTSTQNSCTNGNSNNNAGASSSQNNGGDQNAEVGEAWEENIVTEEMIDIMKKYQANKLPVDDIIRDPTISHWFELLPKKDAHGSYSNSHYRCNKCFVHGPEFLFHDRYLSELSKENGVLKPLKKQNSRIIKEHHLQPSHMHIIRQLKRKEDQRIDEEISGIIQDEVQYKGTNKHISLVYSGICKTNF